MKLRNDIFYQMDFHHEQSPQWYMLHDKVMVPKFIV